MSRCTISHLDVLAGELADGVQQVVVVAGQEPAVERGAGALRDDVVLVAGLGHGEVRGVLQRPADEALGAAEVVEQLVEVLVGVATCR